MTMATNQQQMGALLKAVIAKGVETKDAVPTIKLLIQAKIFRLEDLTDQNMPPGIQAKIQTKLLPQKRKRGSSVKSSSNKKAKATGLNEEEESIVQPPVTAKPNSVMINRSPVMTLWATIVAQHVYPKLSLEEALSIGSAVAATTAKAKGTSLGIYAATTDEKKHQQPNKSDDDDYSNKNLEFQVLGVRVQVQKIQGTIGKDTIRALASHDGQIHNPTSTWKHLKLKFGDSLGFVMAEMTRAAENCIEASGGDREALESSSYQYYMHIRPDIPSGTKGWGAHGKLETKKLPSLGWWRQTDK